MNSSTAQSLTAEFFANGPVRWRHLVGFLIVLWASASPGLAQGVGVGQRVSLTSALGLNAAGGQFAQVFVPDYYAAPADGSILLLFHLHSASWAAEDIAYKSRANAIVFNIHLGGFSSAYQSWFSDPAKFQTCLDATLSALRTNQLVANPRLERVVVSSFSAGYAGVRAMLSVPSSYNRVDALLLGDSLYSDSQPMTKAAQMAGFLQFAKEARDFKKVFLFTHSSVTTSGYDSTVQTADYLIAGLGATRVPMATNDIVGTQTSRCDAGQFQVKGYLGASGTDHLKHLYGLNLLLWSAIPLLHPSNPPPHFHSVALLPDKTLQVGFSAMPGADFLLEASTGMAVWQPLALLGTAARRWSILDCATNAPARFYRARSTPVRVFANFETFAPGASALFRTPSHSGSTSNFLDLAEPPFAYVTNVAGSTSSQALRVGWRFKSNASNPWLRFTTFNAMNVANPTVRFDQAIQFDLLTDRDLFVAMGLRETATTNTPGADGGTSGSIEWIGGVTDNSLSPPLGRFVPAGRSTLFFAIPFEPVRAFTGNGVLNSVTGQGVFEHLAIVPAGSSGGPFNVYLANFQLVDLSPHQNP